MHSFIVLYLRIVLKPVHEYNIVEKIQSANSRLFGPSHQTEPNATMNDDKTQPANTDNTNKEFLYAKHRVTFSSDVEEYDNDDFCEDDDDDDGCKDDEDIDREVAEITESEDRPTDEMDGLMRFMSIHDTIYPDDDDDEFVLVNDNENKYLPRLNNSEDTNDMANGHVATSNQGSIETITLPCRTCSKPHTAKIQQTCHKRPTSSKPIGTVEGAKRKNAIHRSKNRIASALPTMPLSSSSLLANRNVSNDLFKIHLNVRACCENKYLDNNRLPRYNGYISQYGLSKDQMEQRKLNRQKFMEQRTRRNREILKAKEEIAHLNEAAFRQWLIRKNHLSRLKYKNMYDLSA